MKTKISYFLLVSIAISIIGWILLPSRWSYVIFGAFAFVAGSIVQYEEWKTGKRKRAIIFVITLTIGGLLTTLGWNKWGDYSLKKALIRALASEWAVNELFLLSPMFNFDPNDPNLVKLRERFLLFKTSNTYSIVTSHLFDLRDKDDRALWVTSLVYELSATNCNTMLTSLNWDIPRGLMTEHKYKEMRQKIIYTSEFRTFKEFHQEMKNILQTKYNWALEETKPFIELIEKDMNSI